VSSFEHRTTFVPPSLRWAKETDSFFFRGRRVSYHPFKIHTCNDNRFADTQPVHLQDRNAVRAEIKRIVAGLIRQARKGRTPMLFQRRPSLED
jgi:hypothetical protein